MTRNKPRNFLAALRCWCQVLTRLLRRKGAAALAGAIAFAVKLNHRANVARTRFPARKPVLSGRRRPGPALASRARLHHRARGQALIEFALLAPLIFLFLFAIVDFSIAIDRRLVLQHAVREGARYGAVHTSSTDIINYTRGEAQGIPATFTVSYIDTEGDEDDGDSNVAAVRVCADYTWNLPILHDMARVFGVNVGSIEMTPSATARLEQSVSGGSGATCPGSTPPD